MPSTMMEPSATSCVAGSQHPLPLVLHTRVVTQTGGGPEKTILNSPRFLQRHGYRSLCAFMHPPNDPGFDVLRQRATAAEAPIVSVPDRGAWDWRVVTQLLDVCRREKVSVWHAHDYKSNAVGLLLQRFFPMHLVTTVHGWGVQGGLKRKLYYAVDRRCLGHYERVICVSEDLRDVCRSLKIPDERCELIHNAIDTEQCVRSTSIAEAKAELGFRTDRLLVGAVGRLSVEKGFDMLIDAVSQLAASGHDVELAVAGEGDDRSRLETIIASQPEPERFRLLGHVADTAGFYQAMDVFALSSLREGLPNVVLEAMAYEVPVMATRIAGVPRLVEDGTNGLLIDPGSTEAILAGLQTLATSEPLRRRFGQAGRQTVESRFSFAARMDSIAKIYDEVLSGSPRQPATTTLAGTQRSDR